MAAIIRTAGLAAIKPVILLPSPARVVPMEEMPPFRPVKAFLATLPMALNPSLKEPS